MAETPRQKMNRRLVALKSERSGFMQHWRDLNEFILPRQARFTASDRNKGNRRSTKIIDSTATIAARTLSSGMMGGLTSPSRPWFELRTPDPDLNDFQPVKEWLALARDRMAEVFLASNLYTTLPTTYQDLGVFGTNAFATLEDDQDVIRCYGFPVGSYSLGTSYRGNVDTFYRDYQMTVAQLVAQFGYKNCSTVVRNAYDRSNYDQWVDLVHVVEPNELYDPQRMQSKFKAWKSCYYEIGTKEDEGYLSESGFNDFPIMAPRWFQAAEGVYADQCPGMDALGDVMALQLLQKRKAEAIAKQIRPPLKASSSMRNSPISGIAGDVTYLPDQEAASAFGTAYQVNIDLSGILEDIREGQGRINEAFNKNLFMMLSDIQHGQMTAQEVAARQQEKLMLMGPVLERLNDELFDPLIDRTFNIMARRNLLPPPPDELRKVGGQLNIEYVSIMAQAAKMAGIANVEHFMQFTGNLMAANPKVALKIDFFEAVDAMGNMLAVPPKIIRPTDQAQKMSDQQDQQAQIAQAAALAQSAAQTGKTLADTQVTSPSALSQMMAQAQGVQ